MSAIATTLAKSVIRSSRGGSHSHGASDDAPRNALMTAVTGLTTASATIATATHDNNNNTNINTHDDAAAAASITHNNVGFLMAQHHRQTATAASAAAAVDAASTNPSLLREWNYPRTPHVLVTASPTVVVVGTTVEAGDAAATAAAAASTAASPPQNSQQIQQQQQQQTLRSSPFAYTYPVATFVSSIVRQAVMIDPMSIRSESDIMASSDHQHQHHQLLHHHHQTVSARTVDDHDIGFDYDDAAEFILVDGDLIALPPPPPNQAEQEGLEQDAARRGGGGAFAAAASAAAGYSDNNKTCHVAPSGNRVRRGVRRLGKWFRAGKGRRNRAMSASNGEDASFIQDSSSNNNNNLGPMLMCGTGEMSISSSTMTAAATTNAPAPAVLSRQSSAGEATMTASPQQTTPRRRSRRMNRLFPVSGVRSRNDTAEAPFSNEVQREEAAARLHDATTGLLSAAQLQLQQLHHHHHQMGAITNHHRISQDAAAAVGMISPSTTGAPAAAAARTQSVTASLIGTADQLIPEAGVLAFASECYYDDNEKEKEEMPLSLVPADADFKVDKADAPDVGEMLLRAAVDTNTDLDASEMTSSSFYSEHPQQLPRGAKLDGDHHGVSSSIPLSQAHSTDRYVHNDTLKVCLVGSPGVDKSTLGRAIRQSTKRPRTRTTLGIDVHTWATSGVRFQLWDVQGASNTTESSSPNFGAHPATQSLFFSSQSLYLLVWDLAVHNPHTRPAIQDDDDDNDDEDESDDEDNENGGGGNDCAREESHRQADRALQEDIQNRVLSWVDTIARRAPRSAILPVAIIPDEGMTDKEAKRRCDKMHELLELHMQKYQGNSDWSPNVVLDDSQTILCVNYKQGFGVKQLQETMVAIATDTSRSVFDHVGTPVPPGTVEVLELIRRVKNDHKFISLDHVLGELGGSINVKDVTSALHFLSSIGEVLYFGTTGDDDVLSSFIVLSRKWLVSALSCIMRNNLRREVRDARRFMNMQCIYSEHMFHENEIIRTLTGDEDGAASSCPLLSADDARMLWQSMSFMREAADRYSQLNESSATVPKMFYFLHELLVHVGIFLPLESLSHHAAAGLDRPSQVFFVPSLLTQADPGDIWSYRRCDSWNTTLCHSWLFRDGAPEGLFENLTASLLNDLYTFSRTFQNSSLNPPSRGQPQRSRTVPLGHAARDQFLHEHQSNQAIGPIRIHQVVCWKSALLLKIGTVYPENEGNGEVLRESFVEILVAVEKNTNTLCVASDAMRSNMHRIIVSGRGPVGHHARKLWKGGYTMVLDSIQASIVNYNNVNMQVVCPECLGHGNPRSASTWSWDEVCAAAEDRSQSSIVCRRGHRVKSNLLCGTCKDETTILDAGHSIRTTKPISEILPAVVLVGLWDGTKKEIRNVGSGFIADKRLGLIVTAGHVLFNMQEGRQYGTQYFGLRDARVVIGVIPEGDGNRAVFRYFGEIVTSNVDSNVDACVIRITTKMENDVDDEGQGCSSQPEMVLDATKMKHENLARLKMESNFVLEETIRVVGFNQGGGGLLEPGRHVLRNADFAKGYICGRFDMAVSDDSSASSDAGSRSFLPNQEIICMLNTLAGHSGGPCVNDEGLVVGILSRADPSQRERCYLVPANQLKDLLKRARSVCSRPVYPTTRPQLSKLSTV